MASIEIYKGKSKKYKGVYIYEMRNEIKYKAGSGVMATRFFDTEREAALHFDKMMIFKGKSPVNILKQTN
jgi:hypothetical protein